MRAFRHCGFHTILISTIISFLAGGPWMWTGVVVLALGALFFDSVLPEDKSDHEDANTMIANTLLFLMLPLIYFNIILFNWQMSPGDWLSIGAFIEGSTGWNVLAAKASRTPSHTIGAYVSLGMVIASGGTTVAHELVHRVWSPVSMNVGRWLLAPTMDTTFSIEHVHGHHAKVGTQEDPATSRRGETVFAFALRSTLGAFMGAWRIEKERLRKRAGTGPWTFKSVFLRGQMMSFLVCLLYVWAQGAFGVLSFAMIAVYGKFYLELINYIEHYGLVREPGKPVEPKHSWNCNNRFSLWYLFNLPRHSHHHMKGHLPYWKLKANDELPTLPFGYMGMIILALVPPLFRRVMERPLARWGSPS